VEEDGRLVGILTRKEILSAAHSPDRFTNVRDIMKTKFPSLAPGADLFKEGYKLLGESGLRALPVVDNDKLAGMLTIEDIGQASLLRRPTRW
jgi:CBS domain-containing protein